MSNRHFAVAVVGLMLGIAFSGCIMDAEYKDSIQSSDNPPGGDGTRITIAAVGDVLMHKGVHTSAESLIDISIADPYLRVSSGFEAVFEEVSGYISAADIAVANLETPIAEGLGEERYTDENGRPMCAEVEVDPGDLYDGAAYSGKPFNTHPAMAKALKNTGFDLVSTANNHALDRGSNGVDRTIDALRKADLGYVGTLKYDEIIDIDEDGFPDNVPYVVKDVKGIKVAFFAWTYGTNGYMGASGHPDKYKQTYSLSFSSVDMEGMSADPSNPNVYPSSLQEINDVAFWQYVDWIKEASKNSSIDAIVVLSHFGIECLNEASPFQKIVSRILLEAGADIIIGGHAHVLQPMERYITSDGRETFVIYTIGNFVAEWTDSTTVRPEPTINPITSVIINIDISKTATGIRLGGVSYIPIFSYKRDGTIKVVPVDEYPELNASRELVQKVFWGTTADRLAITAESLVLDFYKNLELLLLDIAQENFFMAQILADYAGNAVLPYSAESSSKWYAECPGQIVDAAISHESAICQK